MGQYSRVRLVYQKHHQCNHSIHSLHYRPERCNSQFIPWAHKKLLFPRRALRNRAAEQKGCNTKTFLLLSDNKALSGKSCCESNVTKLNWILQLNLFHPPAPLENQEKTDSIHRSSKRGGGGSLCPSDRAALRGSVTLRCCWRHSTEEQARHVKHPQAIPEGRLPP